MASGKLKIDMRRERIMELLKRDGRVSVLALSRELGATPVTIRSDLDCLAQEGRLERIQGGAISTGVATGAWIDPARNVNTCIAEKEAIAKHILSLVRDGDTLFMNSGTTTAVIAKALATQRRVNVVTNSLAVAHQLAHSVMSRVVLLGGELNPDYGFTHGVDTIDQLQRYQPTWSILSVDGVDAERGITTYHAEEVIIDRAMMERSHQTIIAADHRKVGWTGFTRICGIEGHTLVTDSGSDPAVLEGIRNTGAKVCVAPL